MLPEFERLTKTYPDEPCFTFTDSDGSKSLISYQLLRLKAAALAIILQKKGVGRGSLVSIDMENCPAFVLCVLAAAYGGFALVALNHRLTEDEKSSRLTDLRLMQDLKLSLHLDENKVKSLLAGLDLQGTEGLTVRGVFKRKSKKKNQKSKAAQETPNLGEIIHFAERGAAFFDLSARALVLFTSGTSGKAKAASLSWANLSGAAEASNLSLASTGRDVWQLALPLFHVGGFEIAVRSILGARPFLLYRSFSPEYILADTIECGVSHLSLVDKMLQDLIASDHEGVLRHYSCILLGGAAPNPNTLVEAHALGAPVYVSYGMTETASQIASSPVTQDYQGGLTLLPGYEVEIITPDERGFGQLAVKGPGVFSGYLNARAAFTADGFFLTGDTASFERGKLKVQERLSDMFVSGGENIYPVEIQEKLMRVSGVRDAYAFPVLDKIWGRRPVAFVERGVEGGSFVAGQDAGGSREGSLHSQVSQEPQDPQDPQDPQNHQNYQEGFGQRSAFPDLTTPLVSPQAFAVEVKKSLEQRLSKLYQPKHICVLDTFPRTGIGKVDRAGLRQVYDERIEIHEIRLYHIKQKFVTPIHTAKTSMRVRESMIVEVFDSQGRSGLGECVAFPTDWYLPEILADDFKALEDYLIPLVLQQIYLHPREVSVCFDECSEVAAYPLAKAALEPALWDLYGKIVGEPLWRLLREEAASGAKAEESGQSLSVPAGAVLGIMSEAKTLSAVQQALDKGYTRIKFKVKTGDDLSRIHAVRKAFPELMIMLDANQAYTEHDLEKFQLLDDLAIRCIEEPLNPARKPQVGPSNFFARIARLQKVIKTPICLDESIVTSHDMEQALRTFDLRCFALKIAKWGGIKPALDIYRQACERGIDVWMGGMYETGISKRLHAAFEALPGITIPGDLASSSRYFASDICEPAFETVGGLIVLNQEGFETGLGCILNRAALSKVLVAEKKYERKS